MSRVVIAGAGALGQSLATRLQATHEVRLAKADLTTVHETEVAFAGAQTVVMLARTNGPVAKLSRAAPADLDLLLADSVARAAKLVGVKHLVHFACGDDDARVPLLERAGVPLSVLRGGGPDPVELLAAMVNSGPGAKSMTTPAWTGPARAAKEPTHLNCSVQRYVRPAGWSALDFARAYFTWLPSDVPTVKTVERAGAFTIDIAGVRALVLRHVPGRSSDDLAWLEVSNGALVRRGGGLGRFEFRVLLDQVTVVASLVGYESALPFPLYRFTQAAMHERVMRHFGAWLETQP